MSVGRTVVATKKHEKHQKHEEGGVIECGLNRSSDKKHQKHQKHEGGY